MERIIQLLVIMLIAFQLTNCSEYQNSKNNNQGEMVEMEEEVVVVDMTPKEDLITARSLVKSGEILVPQNQDKSKYAELKKSITQYQNELSEFLTAGKNKDYSIVKGIDNKYLTEINQAIVQNSIDVYLQNRTLDESSFAKELNWMGLALGYSLLDDLGDKKDKSKFSEIDLAIKKLIKNEVITDSKVIRYKIYEKELNLKMEPAPGKELSTKTTVDENGNIFINGQKMGKAVDEDGVFYMQIDPALLLPN